MRPRFAQCDNESDDVVALPYVVGAPAGMRDDSYALIAESQGTPETFLVKLVELRVANAAREHLDDHLAAPRVRDLDLVDDRWLVYRQLNGRSGLDHVTW